MTSVGFSLELASAALTVHDGLPGQALCRHGDAIVLADATGLYRVGGSRDLSDADAAGEGVAARFSLPPTDGGLAGPTRLLGVVVEGWVAGELEVAATSDAGCELVGLLGPVGLPGAPGRAMARLGREYGQVWRVTLAAVDGAPFDIGAVSLVLLPLDRRPA